MRVITSHAPGAPLHCGLVVEQEFLPSCDTPRVAERDNILHTFKKGADHAQGSTSK